MQTTLTRTTLQRLSAGSHKFAPALLLARRSIQTERLSPIEAENYLNKQRNLRPESPWDIYQPQFAAATSLLHRGTGVGLAIGVYGLFISQALPVGLDTEALVSFYSSWPEYFKYTFKTLAAFPFTYHFANGIRHLVWDMGGLLTLKTGDIAGYAVVATSVASALALVAWF